MLLRWYLRIIAGSLFMGMVYCQDNNPLSMENEPEMNVILAIDTRAKYSNTAGKPFACHHCINCQKKSNFTIDICRFDTNMCFTTHKRIRNTVRIIRRGCTTSKGQCIVPDDGQINSFDSITCCTGHTCNQGMQFEPLFFLFILNLFIISIRI